MSGPLAEVEPRWVFLHGFTQTHQSWWPAIDALRRRRSMQRHGFPSLVLPDLPGHGLSTPPTEPVAQTATDLLNSIGTEPTVIFGYSMGARIALSAAVQSEPADTGRGSRAAIRGLVLIGSTAGIDDPIARADRVTLDDDRAAQIERDGVASFLESWTRLDLFGGYSPADLDYRLRNNPTGLANSLRHHGTGAQPPLWAELATMTIPTLLIAGARDDKFVELGTRMHALLPNATFATIPGAAHAAHLERPEEFAAITTKWLDQL